VVDAEVMVSVYTELTTVELWVLDGYIRRNYFGEGKTLKLTIARILRCSNVVIYNVCNMQEKKNTIIKKSSGLSWILHLSLL